MNTARPALAIVDTMLQAAKASAQSIASRIANVRLLPYDGSGPECITFTLDGKPYHGTLEGRNGCLCVGMQGEEADRAIAARVLIDGDAVEMTP